MLSILAVYLSVKVLLRLESMMEDLTVGRYLKLSVHLSMAYLFQPEEEKAFACLLLVV